MNPDDFDPWDEAGEQYPAPEIKPDLEDFVDYVFQGRVGFIADYWKQGKGKVSDAEPGEFVVKPAPSTPYSEGPAFPLYANSDYDAAASLVASLIAYPPELDEWK